MGVSVCEYYVIVYVQNTVVIMMPLSDEASYVVQLTQNRKVEAAMATGIIDLVLHCCSLLSHRMHLTTPSDLHYFSAPPAKP